MEIILDPNVAYLLIVVGFILTIFAILTPGTGIFEVGAVIVLGLAAWRVLELEINVWALIVLVGGSSRSSSRWGINAGRSTWC